MDLDATTYWINQLFPAELELGEHDGLHLAAGEIDDDQVVACTRNFADTDTGLRATEGPQAGVAVRSELFSVARATKEHVSSALVQVAQHLSAARGSVPAQPGVLLPELVDLPGCTVSRALLVVPYVWGLQVPQLKEPSRLTVMLQVLMLTKDEAEYASAYGANALQSAIQESEIDLLEWSR